MKRVRTHRTGVTAAVCILVFTVVFSMATMGDGQALSGPPGPPVPADRDLRLPPIPNEAEVMRAVFASFPDVDPKEVLSFIEEQFPLELYNFKNTLMRKREDAVEMLASLIRESLSMMSMERTAPERFKKLLAQQELERKAAEHAEESRRKEGPAKEEAVRELHDTLAEAFRIKQDLMKTEIEDLSAELEKLEKLVVKRDQNRQAIIARQIGRMTGELDPLNW